MLAMLRNVPETPDDWARFSFANFDALNQIRGAILAQKNIQLPEYPVEPIPFHDLDFWLISNQQAHNDFNSVLGLNGMDLMHTDLRDPNQREAWIYINFMEVQAACQALGIGP